ncbi:DUF1566 domain-containing protein [Candidatus Magnetobacterium casense]|uniref:Lcl C-terminal domain-containing protein n=1 Tax=Candidatus Magnetobacterium casense TaxID=1455061 RepID=UPI0006990C90|nr:DUF1566 domain-containing protein [Candidatus Magnetobacterium casensis]
MLKKVIFAVLLLSLILPVAVMAATVSLPETGQTTSYATGDDGALQRGVAWPSPRFTDNGNQTVTDNLTGLMWTKDANLPGGSRIWQQALDYVASMNTGAGTYGYTDWQLPNRKELFSLVDRAMYAPSLPSGHPFTNVQSDYYWSSTSCAYNTSSAWIVHMHWGYVGAFGKSFNGYYVWPVRGGHVDPLVNLAISISGTGDGTVTSAPAGINCGATCSASFATGTSVTLTATASDNATAPSTFAGWSWDCTGTTSTCTLTMSAAKEVTATFNTATEEQGPGGNDPNYDGNGDGVPDRLQGNVESFHAANSQYITVAADPSVNISTISSVTTPDLGGLGLTTGNASTKLPVGTLSFTLTGVQTGTVNQVKFYLPRGIVVNHVKKYGTSGWYDFDCNGKFRGTPCGEISGGRNNLVVTLYLIDNQLGDIDSTVGTIQDPVALLSPAQVTYTLPYLHTNPVNVTYCVISNMTADTSTVGVELTATAAGNMSGPTNDLISTMTTANKQINAYQTRMLTFNGKDISLDTNVIGSIPEVAPKSGLYGSYGASIVITSESAVDPVGLSCGSVPMACFQGNTLPKRNLVGYLCRSNNLGALGGTAVFTY